MKTRIYRKQYSRVCKHCSNEFTTWNRAAGYCTKKCRSAAARQRQLESPAGDWLKTPVKCGRCGTEFLRTMETGPNKKYCSLDCVEDARRRDMLRFAADNNGSMKDYNQSRVKKWGRDTLLNRLKKRYPDLPKACECCGESRVIEIAHKPEFKRNGAWRTMDVCQRHMFWVLCPTCHRVLDFKIETPEQMGLIK